MAARILIVDDEPQVRATVREALVYEGYEVTEAADGAAALKAIEEAAPDVILFDLWMPVMDGWELRERLRQAQPGLRIIVLSAVELKPDDLARLDVPIVVEKPFELDDLYAAVRDVLARD